MTSRLTPQAERDIDQILDQTLTSFGIAQFRKYQSLLDRAIADIAEIPFRPGSNARPELGNSYRSWHVQLTGRRHGAASHVIFYFCQTNTPGTDIVILRILHERMDPERHLSQSVLRGPG